jgi:hypothetical protein
MSLVQNSETHFSNAIRVIVKKKKHSWCAKVSDGSIALISIKG